MNPNAKKPRPVEQPRRYCILCGLRYYVKNRPQPYCKNHTYQDVIRHTFE